MQTNEKHASGKELVTSVKNWFEWTSRYYTKGPRVTRPLIIAQVGKICRIQLLIHNIDTLPLHVIKSGTD